LYSHEFPPGYIDLYSNELNVLNVSNFILVENQEKCKRIKFPDSNSHFGIMEEWNVGKKRENEQGRMSLT
jgi:hypothetical protein